ncbi:MAG: hypothetical protein O2960_07730 [Verrucomicrobia bacterium]|nr:hypothetical protein [Verrucomicrobiota bacterium]
MNAKLLFKTIFLIVVLLLLVLMGMHNLKEVTFSLPPIVTAVKSKAAIMYFAFFAVGVLTGTVLTAGGGKQGSRGSSSKTDKK